MAPNRSTSIWVVLSILLVVAAAAPASAGQTDKQDALADLATSLEFEVTDPVHEMDELGEFETQDEKEDQTEEAYEAIDEAREGIPEVEAAIDNARAAGVDEALLQDIEQALADLDQIHLPAARADLDNGDLVAARGHFGNAESQLESLIAELERREEAAGGEEGDD